MTLYLISPRAGRCGFGRTAQPEGHVLEHGHVAEQGVVLEDEAHLPAACVPSGDVLVVEQDGAAAAVRLLQAGDNPQQRGLARARRAKQRHQFAGGDRKAHVAQCRERAEGLADVADFNAHAFKS